MSSTPTLAAATAPAAPPSKTTLDAIWQALQRPPRKRALHLGEALVASGLVSVAQVKQTLEVQRQAARHRLLGQLLIDAGHLSEDELDKTLADWLGLVIVDPRTLQPEPEALSRVPKAFAQREGVLPLMMREDTLVVALADPNDRQLIERLRFLSDLKVMAVGASAGALSGVIATAYAALGADGSAGHQSALLHDLAAELQARAPHDAENDAAHVSESDNTLVRLVNRLITDAVVLRASDIHIEVSEAPHPIMVRLRIDGELVRHIELPGCYRHALVGRLKIMSDLDISEHRKPQDGKIDFGRFGGPAVELRVVIVPTSRGLENVVLRLLGGREPMPIETLGLSTRNLARLREVMHKAYGLILICGPTGCGKTTTLHSVLRELNTDQRKIWTAEDPIEITQAGLQQVQVNAQIGWTFAAAMRTFLRADPDVIMIGEMRDAETARIATEASLTGHLVMSTLHTNSAPESVTRLLEIGLDPFLFSDSLLAVLAQRLVRRLCRHCRQAETLDDAAVAALVEQYRQSSNHAAAPAAELVQRWQREHGDAQGRLVTYRRRGCSHCGSTGYHGRLGLHELLLADDSLRERIRRRASAAELQAAGIASGMTTLRQDGIEKMLAGHTDMAEVLASANQ